MAKSAQNLVTKPAGKIRHYIFKQVFLIYLLSFVETPRKFIIAELSIRKLESSSVLIMYIIIMYNICIMYIILLAHY